MAIHFADTENGRVQGVPGNDPRISVFKGMPFAAPPVGKNRWKAPQPVKDWEGVYQADRFRGRCPQAQPDDFYLFNCGEPFEEADEDCLYLNVWTPAESPEEKLPVFLWIHGGANVMGWGHFPFVDGEGFAKRGVIFVSFNWRVNVFGWLTHPELDMENERHVSGNYGVLDQIAALRWVRRNIAAFGGDPENITVAGESAGGSSTMNLCCTPPTRGMFRHASMHSGGGWDLFVSNSVPSLAQSEAATDLKRLFGVDSIAQARELPPEELIRRASRPEAAGAYIPSHVVDGWVFTKTNRRSCLEGEMHPVDYIIGYTGEETHMYEIAPDRQLFLDGVQAEYGEHAGEYLALCDFLKDDDAFKEHLRVRSAEMLKTGALAFAETMERYGNPVYMYCFSHSLPGEDGGSFHSCELWYQFETLNRSRRPFTGKDYDLAVTMADYWTDFCKTGNPNGGGRPEWSKYTKVQPLVLHLDTPTEMRPFELTPRIRFRKDWICR